MIFVAWVGTQVFFWSNMCPNSLEFKTHFRNNYHSKLYPVLQRSQFVATLTRKLVASDIVMLCSFEIFHPVFRITCKWQTPLWCLSLSPDQGHYLSHMSFC